MRQSAVVIATGLVFPVLAVASLCAAMPFEDALSGTLGGWVHVTNEELTALPFYSDGRGTQDTAASLAAMAKWTGWFAVALTPSLLVSYWARLAGPSQRRTVELTMVAAVAVLVWVSNWCVLDGPGLAGYFFPGELSFSPILVFILILTSLFAARYWRRRDERSVLALILCALALGLLPKILLNVRFHQYGFGLAFPATLLSVVGLLSWLPRRLARLGWAGGVFRGGALGLLVALLIGCMKIVGLWFSEKSAVQGGEYESFHCRESAYTQPTRFVMPWLLENTKPTDTLVVLPEGISMNYFTRRVNPTRQINFMPPEVIMYSEDRVLSDLQANPADYVVLVHRITGEYGPDYTMFGTHYGRTIMQWVAKNYEGIKMFGAQPLHADRLEDGRWGALIMKRMKR